MPVSLLQKSKGLTFLSKLSTSAKAPVKLDVGTASTSRGFLSVGISEFADVQINLEGDKGRIPLEDKSTSVVSCSHLLEHLTFDGLQATLYDIWRLIEDDGFVSIVVPDTDTNSFWKGLRDHKDMRMNPYFFRSTSTQPQNALSASPYFMTDYDGYAFGMQQGYMTGGFDFDLIHLKLYPTQKYAMASDKLISFASRSFTNVMDSYRIIMKKSGSSGPRNIDYLGLILQLPQIEIDREVMYSRQRVRQFNNLTDILINDFDTIEKSSFIEAIYDMEKFDLVENFEIQYRSLKNDVEAILKRLKGAATPADLVGLHDAMNLADGRYRIVEGNLNNIRGRLPRPYRQSDEPKPPKPEPEIEPVAEEIPHEEPVEPPPPPRVSLLRRIVRRILRALR
jgi:hypothetical protein